MNVNPVRVTPTPTAPTFQVHMSATVPLVFMEMTLIVKVRHQLLLISLTSMKVQRRLQGECYPMSRHNKSFSIIFSLK